MVATTAALPSTGTAQIIVLQRHDRSGITCSRAATANASGLLASGHVSQTTIIVLQTECKARYTMTSRGSHNHLQQGGHRHYLGLAGIGPGVVGDDRLAGSQRKRGAAVRQARRWGSLVLVFVGGDEGNGQASIRIPAVKRSMCLFAGPKGVAACLDRNSCLQCADRQAGQSNRADSKTAQKRHSRARRLVGA